MAGSAQLIQLKQKIAKCRICRDEPLGDPLPHDPRPVLIASQTARIAIYGQAPGTRVHASGKPFTDPSGDRLRDWLGVDAAEFYDPDKFAIVPMGFCFPGLDKKGGDLPPRKECALNWRQPLMDLMPQIRLVLIVGIHAQAWHLGKNRKKNLTETVAAWREYVDQNEGSTHIPLPHPSWRNNAWLKKNSWFEQQLLPFLKERVQQELSAT